jgi:hypothetical protein
VAGCAAPIYPYRAGPAGTAPGLTRPSDRATVKGRGNDPAHRLAGGFCCTIADDRVPRGSANAAADGASVVHTLQGFIGGRISEDEQIAEDAIDGHESGYRWGGNTTVDGPQMARWNPWRVLSNCVCKRLIASAHRDAGPGVERRPGRNYARIEHTCSTCGQRDGDAIAWPCYTLKVMALDWVEHVDDRIEWRPQRGGSTMKMVSRPESDDAAKLCERSDRTT